MRKTPLYFPFLLALVAALFGNVVFPSLHLSFFVPFLALTYYAASVSKALKPRRSYLSGPVLPASGKPPDAAY